MEVVEHALRRIERLNPVLNAFISVREAALDEARLMERAGARGRTSPLFGVPISIKDLMLMRDGRTTAGSRIFGDGLESNHDAPVVRRLKRAGAIVVGKTNLHELALGVTNVNEHFGPAHNPWDVMRVCGGSSGGSAVAVATRLGYASVGSDTRGSIRIPAACCGVTGLKPTYGLVPVDDVIPLSWSLDHVGPITRSVEDAALLLGPMTGRGGRYLKALGRSAKQITVGVCEYFLRDLDPEIERAVLAAIDVFRAAGCKVREVAMPEVEGSHGASGVITLAEAVTYHDKNLRERPQNFGKAVFGRLEPGYKLTALDLVRAERKRVEVVAGFARAFQDVDCLIGATIPAFPPAIGEDTIRLRGRETTLLAEFPRLTSPANLAGAPALSIPCGMSASGLPIGLQLMAARGKDEVVLSLGAEYQRNTDWHRAIPNTDKL